MRQAPQWYRLSSSRLARERAILASLPYFTAERDFFDQEIFSVIGSVQHRGQRSGRQHSLRVKMKYPRTFPRRVPLVFDHDKVFTPAADGHLLASHELCLTLPERNEFTTDSELLTPEVLGATIVWFHKRRLFERFGKWPGVAERHGVNAVIDLFIEQGILTDEETVHVWLYKHSCSTTGNYQTPDRYAPCPCGSQSAIKFCHEETLSPLFARLSHASGTMLLAEALAIK
jgi:hypothetical protein